MKKVLLLIGVIFLFSCVTVYGFTDVDENSEYYEAVNYMYENGIVGGYEDGTFRPDNLISYNELAVILTRSSDIYDKYLSTFDLPHPHWATSYLIFARTQEFFNVSEILYGDVKKCEQPISKGLAIRGMFGMLDLDLYYYRFYEQDIADIGDCESENVQNAVTLAYVMGILDKNEDGALGVKDNITRGEACKILYDLLQLKEKEELNGIVPKVVEDLNIVFMENQGEKSKKFVINELSWIPVDVIKKFNQLDWTLTITGEPLSSVYDFSEYPEYRSAVGLCSYRNKTLYVSYTLMMNIATTLMHEFGHFVEYAYFPYVSDASEIRTLYENEKSNIIEVCGRDYCETNVDEFFAEAFRAYTAYVYYLDSETKVPMYENSTPKTYKFFTDFFTSIDKEFKERVEEKTVNADEEVNSEILAEENMNNNFCDVEVENNVSVS